MKLFHGSTEAFEKFDFNLVEGGVHLGSLGQALAVLDGSWTGGSFRKKSNEESIEFVYEIEADFEKYQVACINSDLGQWNCMEMLKEYFTMDDFFFTEEEFSKFRCAREVYQELINREVTVIEYSNSFEDPKSMEFVFDEHLKALDPDFYSEEAFVVLHPKEIEIVKVHQFKDGLWEKEFTMEEWRLHLENRSRIESEIDSKTASELKKENEKKPKTVEFAR